jgi:eukaryotic-like serine/threonine-protein kinase
MLDEQSTSTSNDDAADGSQLVALVDQLLAKTRAGSPVDIERVVADHPDLAVELRELWAVAALAEEFGSQTSPTDDARQFRQEHSPAAARLGQLSSGFDDYELFEELGRGGMGVVYRAWQRSLDRVVALKIVLAGSAATRADLARFRGEAETAAQLNHPHIVPIYEVGEHNELPYFTMRYVRGTTLAERIAEGPLAGREAAQILAPVARAIAKAHEKGVLHRDLKPSNILIDSEDRPYVSDFGLAKRLIPDPIDDGRTQPFSQVTQTGAILGTPGYMSPEQAAGSRGTIGVSTDIYSRP